MNVYDQIFNPFQKRKQHFMKIILILLLIGIFAFAYGHLKSKGLLEKSNELMSEDLSLVRIVKVKTLNDKTLYELKHLSRFSEGFKKAKAKYEFLSRYFSWADIGGSLNEVNNTLLNIKIKDYEKLDNIVREMYRKDKEIDSRQQEIRFSEGMDSRQLNQTLKTQEKVIDLINKNVRLASRLQATELARIFGRIDERLTLSNLRFSLENERDKLERFRAAYSYKLQEEKRAKIIAYESAQKKLKTKEEKAYIRNKETERDTKVDTTSGLLKFFYSEAKKAVLGEEVREAETLSNKVALRIFDQVGEAGKPLFITIIVTNVGIETAHNVTPYLRLPHSFKATKLEPVTLKAGESERWDLSLQTSTRPGTYKIKGRIVWNNGFYNDCLATLTLR